MKYYNRSGKRISKAAVESAKRNAAEARRTGKLGSIRCEINERLADRFDAMTLPEFINYTGICTYRR